MVRRWSQEERLDYARRSVLNYARRSGMPNTVELEDLVQDGIVGVLADDPPDMFVGACAVNRMLDAQRRWHGLVGDEKELREPPASWDEIFRTGPYDWPAPEQMMFFKEELAEALEKRKRAEFMHDHPSARRTVRLDDFRARRKPLGVRELEVLRAAAAGMSADETAVKMGRSVETVKSQRRMIIAKLDARNMMHAVARGYEEGLLGTAAPEMAVA